MKLKQFPFWRVIQSIRSDECIRRHLVNNSNDFIDVIVTRSLTGKYFLSDSILTSLLESFLSVRSVPGSICDVKLEKKKQKTNSKEGGDQTSGKREERWEQSAWHFISNVRQGVADRYLGGCRKEFGGLLRGGAALSNKTFCKCGIGLCLNCSVR